MVEFRYINRKLRLAIWALEYGILTPLVFFFFACAYSKSDSTLLENLFGFEKYWRTIGYVGLPITLITIIVIPTLALRKNGILKMSETLIELTTNGRTEQFNISMIKDLVLTKDVPFRSDERSPSQIAGRLRFSYGGNQYDLEFKPHTISDYNDLLEIANIWKEEVPGYRLEYKS